MNRFVRDLPAADYHKVEALSASGAKKLLKSALHYRLERDHPSEPTASMQLGTRVHLLVLERARVASGVAIFEGKSRKGKAWDEFELEHAGQLIVTVEEFGFATAMADSVADHPAAAKLLAAATEREFSLFWTDAQYGVPCKCRFDLIALGGGVDLKSTSDASPDGFPRLAATYGYHIGAAHYNSGAEHVLNESLRFFVLIAVENEPPHAVAVYNFDPADIMAGQHQMAIAAERYRDALARNVWAGYSPTIQPLRMPRWARRFDV